MPQAKSADLTAEKTRAELLADLATAGFDDVSQVGSDVTEGDITQAVYRCTWRNGSIVTARNCGMQIKLLGDPAEKAAWEAASARWLSQVASDRQIAMETIWPEYLAAVEAGWNIGSNDGTVLARYPDNPQVIVEEDGTGPRKQGIIQFQEQIATGPATELDPTAGGTYQIVTRRIIYNRYSTESRFSWRVYDYAE